MRTFQDFDPFKIVKQGPRLHIGGEKNAVQIYGGGGRRQRLMVDGADAANLKRNLVAIGDSGLNARQKLRDFFRAVETVRLVDLRPADHIDARRNVAEALHAF